MDLFLGGQYAGKNRLVTQIFEYSIEFVVIFGRKPIFCSSVQRICVGGAEKRQTTFGEHITCTPNFIHQIRVEPLWSWITTIANQSEIRNKNFSMEINVWSFPLIASIVPIEFTHQTRLIYANVCRLNEKGRKSQFIIMPLIACHPSVLPSFNHPAPRALLQSEDNGTKREEQHNIT